MEGYDWKHLIWEHGETKAWTPEVRLLVAFLLSGRQANRIGCFPVDIDIAAAQTGLAVTRVRDIVVHLEREGFVRHDETCNWIWFPEILRRHRFISTDEVRRALPELAAVPREASFRIELIQLFRASADRPGVQAASTGTWLGGFLGDDRAPELAQRLAAVNARVRQQLPGLPHLEPAHLQPVAKLWLSIADYLGRCRDFAAGLVDTPLLHTLGLISVASAILFVVFPGIDLGVAGWFFDPPRNFALGASRIGRFFDNEVHYAMEWFLVVLVGAFLYGLFRRRPVWGLTSKRFLFVSLSIALSAGLMTNVVFKDSWGRARPSQIVEFGGTKQFSPPFMRSNQCDKNCSFVSGDASLAASFLAFAVIADRHRRRWWLGLGSFAAVVGLMRMARGSHFLSDVVFAVVFTLMIILILGMLFLDERWR